MPTAALGWPVRYDPAPVLGYMRHLRRRGDAETVDPAVERLLGRPATPLSVFIDRNLDRWS